MSARNTHIAFGLSATTIALKARNGELRLRDQVKLARDFFDWVPDDVGARDAVRDFLAMSAFDPEAAGLVLQDWVRDQAHLRSPFDVEAALATVTAEHDWQDRADLQ